LSLDKSLKSEKRFFGLFSGDRFKLSDQQIFQRFFRVSARIETNLAMFVHVSVLFTFITAFMAGSGAGLELTADDGPVRPIQTHKHSAGGCADIGAILVETNAADQWLNVVFAQTRISAGCAELGAVEAGIDALKHGLEVHVLLSRMSLDHFFHSFHDFSPLDNDSLLVRTICPVKFLYFTRFFFRWKSFYI
jgi:hypothetical protein